MQSLLQARLDGDLRVYFYDTEAGITNITDVHVASRANPYILEVRSGQPRAVWGDLQSVADLHRPGSPPVCGLTIIM